MATSTQKTQQPTIIEGKYLLMNVVGSGQFGDVYKAKKINTEEVYALKAIELDLFDNVARLHEMADNEVAIMEKINNPNVVKFIESKKTKTHIYTVYELCTGGTLEELLDKRRYLTEKEALDILRQVLNGFKPLIALNVLHRDIKPSNILFHEGVVKIGDFGFCKPLGSMYEVTETMVGSPIYMAPEILKGQTYSIKADIYSMGVMLYEMLYGRAPYEDVTIPGLLNKIMKGDLYFPAFNTVSPSTQHLIKRMLESIEAQRIDWNDLFNAFGLNNKEESKSAEKDQAHSSTSTSAFGDTNKHNKDLIGNIVDLNHNTLSEKDSELILTLFTKECKQTRDKMMFLWRTFSQGYENILSNESHIVNFLTLRKLNKYSKEVEKIVQNKEGTIKPQEFAFLKTQFDYSRMSSILTTETSKFADALSIYKSYIQTSADPIKPINVDTDPVFTSTEFNEDAFVDKVLAYAQTIRNRFNTSSNTESSGNNLALYLNLILDCVMIDDVYENFFEVGTPFNEQPYLQNLFDMDENELIELADEKLSYVKGSQALSK